MRVQIAGVSTLQDALAVEQAGTDAIGFTLGLSGGPHNGLDEAKTRAIVQALPPFGTTDLSKVRAFVAASRRALV